MIKIFKEHSSKTCILDDFGFYEDREKMIQEKKAKQQQLKKQALDLHHMFFLFFRLFLWFLSTVFENTF
jgi:ribosomal protein S21